MDPLTLSAVCEKVYRQFPEVAGSHPRMQNQPNNNILLIFHGQSITDNGHKIQRTVRVMVSEHGQIVKMTTSR